MALTIYQLTGNKEAVMKLDDDDHIIFSHPVLTSRDRALLRARANRSWGNKQPIFEFDGTEYQVCEST